MSKNELFLIDSADRMDIGNTTSDSFNIRCRKTNIKNIRINRIILPHSYYNVNQYNNQFHTSLGTVTVPVGNYSLTAFAAALQTKLIVLDATFTVTYTAQTGKMTIARTGNFDMTFYDNEYIDRITGFPLPSYTGAATYTSGMVCDITAGHYITIHSKVLSLNKKRIDSSDGRQDMIALVSTAGQFGDVIEYDYNHLKLFDYSYNKEFSDLNDPDFYLLDENGNPLDLNGLEWQLLLEITPFY